MIRRLLISTALCALATLARAEEPGIEVSTATGDVIEFDDSTGFATIEGNARVESSTATMTADKITLDRQKSLGHAEGNVRIEQGSGTITGREVDYSWEGSTGTVYGGSGESPP